MEDLKKGSGDLAAINGLSDVPASRYTQEELEQRISELSSPSEIAKFFLKMNNGLEAEKQKLQLANDTLCSQNADLSKEILEHKKPGTSFTCFSKLPPEIRCMIWKRAEPDRRLVQMKWSITDKAFSCPGNRHPSILHVCKEARMEMLKGNPLCPGPPTRVPRFFNHSKDILYVDRETFLLLDLWDFDKELLPDNIASTAGFDPLCLRFLALDCRAWDEQAAQVIYQTGMFPLLEELILIHSPWELCNMKRTFKIVEQCEHEDMARWLFDGEELEPITCLRYRNDIASIFTKDLEVVNSGIFYSSLCEETVYLVNPWQKKDRIPPCLRIMRMVPDIESTLKLTWKDKCAKE